MCSQCDGFAERIKINSAREYFDLIDQVRIILDQGIMILLDSSCSLKRIKKGKGLPTDYVDHIFRCSTCGRKFRLQFQVYPAASGEWNTTDKTRISREWVSLKNWKRSEIRA